MRSVIIGKISRIQALQPGESCADAGPRWRRVGRLWIPQPARAGWFAPNSSSRSGTNPNLVSHRLERESPDPHVRQRECVPLQCRRPLEGRQRPKKPATVVALSRLLKTLATTGTCEFGQAKMYVLRLDDARKNRGGDRPRARCGTKKEGAARAAPPIAPRSGCSRDTQCSIPRASWRCVEGASKPRAGRSPRRRRLGGAISESCARPATVSRAGQHG